MQFKLLNFHKLVGNFATALVGTFIPLIIYKATNSLRLAALFLLGQCIMRIIANHLLKKLVIKYPQICIILRIIPLLIYNIALIFLEDFIILGIIVIIISYGINTSLKNNTYGILLNYSSKKKTSKNITLTRIVEAVSAIIACVAGGLFIDWNQTILIIFSVVLYLISALPLFIYFIKNRKEVLFNKDFTSNAAIAYDQDPSLKLKRKGIAKNFIIQYFIFYSLFCVVDMFTNMYTLHRFISMPTFAQAGYLTASFQFANLCGVLFVSFIAKKFDLKMVNSIFGSICGLPLIIIPLIQNHLSIYALIFIFGFTYACCSYFMLNSLMTKCKIINATNQALFARQDGIMVGQMIAPSIVLLFNDVVPVFFAMFIALIIYSIYTYIMEEKMRRKLVNYLENNEIE